MLAKAGIDNDLRLTVNPEIVGFGWGKMSLTTSGRLFGALAHELRFGPGGRSLLISLILHAILSPTILRVRTGFSVVPFSFFNPCRWLQPKSPGWATLSQLGSWAYAQGFASSSDARPARRTESSLRRGPVWETATLRTGVSHSGCSPRLHLCAAVAFGYRPVNFGLTGTSTLLNERLHRRTNSSRCDE